MELGIGAEAEITFFSFIFDIANGYIEFIVFAILIGLIIYAKKRGIGSFIFWGRTKERIDEFHFPESGNQFFFYKLSNNRGYKGYGIEMHSPRYDSESNSNSTQMNFLEINKDDADQLVAMLAPRLEVNK